jgi:hypothetical protein
MARFYGAERFVIVFIKKAGFDLILNQLNAFLTLVSDFFNTVYA